MRIRDDLWAILTVMMVVVALFFGLRPKAWFVDNDAQWLQEQGSLQFQGHGIAYVKDLKLGCKANHPDAFTIELAATPGASQSSGFETLLVLHDGADDRQLAVWQYRGSLIVMNGDDYDYRQRRPRIVAGDVLVPGQARHLTIVSGKMGTRLFVDGVSTAGNANWQLAMPSQANPMQLVLGNSVHGRHGWTGSLHGLAIYGEAFAPQSVERHFDEWLANRSFSDSKPESRQLLYSFAKKTGRFIRDESGHNAHLEIPVYLKALQITLLSPHDNAFKWNLSRLSDVLINIFGFMPLGVLFYGSLRRFYGVDDPTCLLAAVALCLLLSLSIEMAQAWIPNRTSSLPDLMLNTVGGWLGIFGWRSVRKWKR